MPELPEVETIRKTLDERLKGRYVTDIEVLRENILKNPRELILDKISNRPILEVFRRGKNILFDFGPSCLIAHLKMTGKFIFLPGGPKPHKHDRVRFHLDRNGLLVFNDCRCFGSIEWIVKEALAEKFSKLGIEPLSAEFDENTLFHLLKNSPSPAKDFLMNQSKIAGIGNIYASEILFRAGIHPRKAVVKIPRAKAKKLFAEIKATLREALDKNGTTISDFRRVDEKTGEFQNFLKVYGKANVPCPNCSTPIERIVQQQRSTFFCRKCQK